MDLVTSSYLYAKRFLYASHPYCDKCSMAYAHVVFDFWFGTFQDKCNAATLISNSHKFYVKSYLETV